MQKIGPLPEPKLIPGNFDRQSMTFRLEFEDPLKVSRGVYRDEIIISLRRLYFLVPVGVNPAKLEDTRLILRGELP